MHKTLYVCLLLSCSCGFARSLLADNQAVSHHPQSICVSHVLGAIEDVLFVSPGIKVKSRVDTGAGISSLHVEELNVYQEKGTYYVHFYVIDEGGNRYLMKEKIAGMVGITNTSGIMEKRYMIRQTIILKGKQFKVVINLNDRTHMSFKFIIGRDLLKQGGFLVDISAAGCKIAPDS